MISIACAVASVALLASGSSVEPDGEQADPTFVLGYTMPSIDGEEVDLGAYKGKVVLIVNTASRCGLTPQYKGLEKLYDDKREDGLVVLGFPANDFGGQEPGTDAQIKEFCTERFEVSFPMFSKVAVTGEQAHPLYQQLAALPEPMGGEPKWNFTKFLVDRSGHVVARYEPRTAPDAPELVAKVDELLAQKP